MSDLDLIIRNRLPSLVEFRHALHERPELGFEEVETSRMVWEKIRNIPGLDIRRNVAKTGLVAVLGGGKKGPCVALRAEMDALPITEETGKAYASKNPGKMHACGHDGHTTCVVGALEVLSEIRDELEGPVKFIFQPSEEKIGGAKVICDEGCLKNPDVDAIFGLHGFPLKNLALGEVAVSKGAVMAGSKGFAIEIQGKGGHAASPHECIDPVYIGSQMINAFQSMVSRSENPLDSLVVSVTRFIAGTARNIIPDSALLEGTIRSLKPERMVWAAGRLKTIAEEMAKLHGGRATVSVDEGYPPLINEDRSVEYFTRIAREVLPKGKLIEHFRPRMSAEDFAFYLHHVPGMFWLLGVRPAELQEVPGLHHPKYDFNDAAMPLAIRMHVELARRFAKEWKT